MSLYDAMQLNLDLIDLLQTQREEEAIQVCAAHWATMNFPLPHQSEPDETYVIPPSPNGSPVASRSASPLWDDEDAVQHVQVSNYVVYPPIFSLQSVLTDDFMSAFPWREWESGNIYTLYHRAFQFRANEDQVMTYSMWYQCVLNLRIVLYYHLGLAFHLLAVKRNTPDLVSLAVQYYETALRVFLPSLQGRPYGHVDTSAMDILIMALYNNMGHCYSYLGDGTRAMLCFVQLHVTFVHSNHRDDLHEEEALFFDDRLALGMAKMTQPAPAA